MRLGWTRPALLALGLLAVTSLPARAEPGRRVALIIGESRYDHKRPLVNAISDAQMVRDHLIALGFDPADVVERENVDRKTLADLLRAFRERAQDADSAVFYFAGHGKGDRAGDAWLLPVDAMADGEDDLPLYGISVDVVVSALRTNGRPATRIVLIDACRNNEPQGGGRDTFRGRLNAPVGGVLAQTSTAFGDVADDGKPGEHSPYAAALAEELTYAQAHDEDVRVLLQNVAERVRKATNPSQTPTLFSVLDLNRSINIRGQLMVQADAVTPANGDDQASEEGAWRMVVGADKAEVYRAFLKAYGAGRHAAEARQRLASLGAEVTASPQRAGGRAAVLSALAAITPSDWHNASDVTLAQNLLSVVRLPDLEAVAESGDARAQVLAGSAYGHGVRGAPRDENRALRFFQMAAAQNDPRGQVGLGGMFLDGDASLPKDAAQAVALFRKAAAQDNAMGQVALAGAYLKGLGGLEASESEATRYYALAAGHGNAAGQVGLGAMNQNGAGGLVRNEREAVRLYRLAAEQNYAMGQAYLGAMYEDGRGVPRDPDKAITYYQQAADQKNAFAQVRLAMAYALGLGVDVNLPAALALFNAAADEGDTTAMLQLGRAYEGGLLGLPQDPEAARRYYRMAAGDLTASGADDKPEAPPDAAALEGVRKLAEKNEVDPQRRAPPEKAQ